MKKATTQTARRNLAKAIKAAVAPAEAPQRPATARKPLHAGTSMKMKIHPKRPNCPAFSLCYGSRDAARLAEFMYAEATICLQRKRQKFSL
jgi:hypothetical protein